MATSTERRQALREWLGCGVAVAIPLFLYLGTLYPGVGGRMGGGDPIEFQFVGRVLGVAHEPGYPQYVLLSHFWSRLPLPVSLAVKINLLAAFLTTAAGVFHYFTCRDSGARITASMVATLGLLTTFDIWLLATQAEVYSLNLLWVAAVVWAAVRWRRSRRQLDLALLFLFYALSFGNHLTMIVLLPGLACMVLLTDWRVVLSWRTWIWALAAVALGLMQYGLLVWRSYHPHPTLLERFPLRASIPQLWDYVTGGSFIDRHWLKQGASAWPQRVGEALLHGIEQLSWILMAFALLGVFVAFRRDRPQALSLALIATSVIGFAAAYGIIDWLYYAIPAWLCLAVWAALGIDAAIGKAQRASPLLLALLVLMLGARATGSVRQLQIESPPEDLVPILEVAKPDSGVLTGRRRRTAHLAEGYYRYGLGLEAAERVTFVSTNEVFAHGFEDFAGRPLYFSSRQIARELEERWVDYQTVDGSPTEPIFVTGTSTPIERLGIRPLWNHDLALEIRDDSRDLIGAGVLHLLLVDGHERRSKGYLQLETLSAASWTAELEATLAVAQPGDWLLVCALRLRSQDRAELRRILSLRGVEIGTELPRHHEVLLWRHDDTASDLRIVQDPSRRIELDLEADTEIDQSM